MSVPVIRRLATVLALAAPLAAAAPAWAVTPTISGPIDHYRCPPVPYWCKKKLKRGIGGWPGITLTHWRAIMKPGDGPTQDLYKISWRLGDPHVHLFAEPLATPNSSGDIPLRTITQWASSSRPAGFAGAMNADFFQYVGWGSGHPSGMLVHGRKVIAFGTGGDGVGYLPGGRMVFGNPMARPSKLTLQSGHTATIGAFDPSSQKLADVVGDQVAVKTTHAKAVNVPLGWVGFVVGDATVRSPFGGMLRGSLRQKNPSGTNTAETVAGFRYGEAGQPLVTLSLPVTPRVCPSYVCAAGTSVTLGTGEALVIAKSGHLAANDLTAIAQSSHHISVSVNSTRWAKVAEVMGGKPRLVKKGVARYTTPWANPPMMSSDGWQWKYKHWRPALVQAKNGYGWMIITGGIKYGDGVYGWNWSRMLQQLGAKNAIGFDNNSSTELDAAGVGHWSFQPGWQRDIAEATAVAYH
ncbi:MAG TPA: phosphodiester glycosidase family protein [Gaiellales bacterium]|nr:phosphodiester glycosidase family protein [Gaiellales bacterium]